jgi:hypothetical protein
MHLCGSEVNIYWPQGLGRGMLGPSLAPLVGRLRLPRLLRLCLSINVLVFREGGGPALVCAGPEAASGVAEVAPFLPVTPASCVQSAVLVSCKLPEQRIDTIAEYQAFLTQEMAHLAINQRLFKISRQVLPYVFCTAAVGAPFGYPPRVAALGSCPASSLPPCFLPSSCSQESSATHICVRRRAARSALLLVRLREPDHRQDD